MTAEIYALENMQCTDMQEIESTLIGFAKLKCEELLKIVAEKAEVAQCENNDYYEYEVDKDSILNAVDLNEFIK